MGRYLGKCKGVMGEIAVVGVRTRARAALAMAAAADSASSGSSLPEKKIRKIASSTNVYKLPYEVHELRNTRRRIEMLPENSASSTTSCRRRETTSSSASSSDVEEAAVICSNSENISEFPASCCSSNIASTGTSEVVKDRVEIADPEQQSADTTSNYSDCHKTAREEESKVGGTESDDLDSSTRLPDEKSTVQIEMPSNSEIEDFFAAAEKDIQKRFTEKYNFDIVKDVPLEGRYEWVPIKP